MQTRAGNANGGLKYWSSKGHLIHACIVNITLKIRKSQNDTPVNSGFWSVTPLEQQFPAFGCGRRLEDAALEYVWSDY